MPTPETPLRLENRAFKIIALGVNQVVIIEAESARAALEPMEELVGDHVLICGANILKDNYVSGNSW